MTPDHTLRHLLAAMGPYEGLLATVVGVEHRDGGPGRRRIVAVATDQRVLLAWVRDSANAERAPYAQVRDARLLTDEHGTHVVVTTRTGEWRIDRIRDPGAGEIFVQLVNARAGRPVRPTERSSRIRLLDVNAGG